MRCEAANAGPALSKVPQVFTDALNSSAKRATLSHEASTALEK
jgi:hypothetical protein